MWLPPARTSMVFFGCINIFLCVLLAAHRWVNSGHQSECVYVFLTLSLCSGACVLFEKVLWEQSGNDLLHCGFQAWYRDHSSWQDTAFCLTPDERASLASPLWIDKLKQHYFNQFFMDLNMSSVLLQATSNPYLPPILHTGSVPQGMLWMRGSWINMEALTPVCLLWQASHQRQRSRWKNLWRFYDFQLQGGSVMMPHRGTGGRGLDDLSVCVCVSSLLDMTPLV